MVDEKTKQALSLWDKFFKTYENLRKAQIKTIFEHDLTGPQFNVLEVLFTTGSMPLKKIGERLYVSGANITCVVDNLEKEGLCKRVPSVQDRRIIIAEITPKGEEKMKQLFPLHARNIFEATSGLTSEEHKELERLLDKMDKK